MKLLTLNFLTCAVKACKTSPSSFPLHIKDAELESVEIEFNELFLRNIVPRLEWEAVRSVARELGLFVPEFAAPTQMNGVSAGDAVVGDGGEAMDTDTPITTATSAISGAAQPYAPQQATSTTTSTDAGPDATKLTTPELQQLHTLLIETQIQSGKLVCGNCGHEYAVKEGIANFLLPAHLVA